MSRRQLLAWTGGTALALVLGGRASAATSASLDDFMALSARLLDTPASSLSPGFGEGYFNALISRGFGDALAGLRDGSPASDLESSILGNWYTGVAEIASGEEVVTYPEAMMWNALDFTKPMGWCGGETGYWADAPEGEA
ncbi:MAG: hypothetical protein IR164_11170 [Devosia sp.]|uniref:sugar dehydrogenase complex small subunit n=1 Tax=Devosia sp. TaxID=1871048 RepID=UPI0019FA1260|nr:sugar dehydrogenase complex small subunit [Devosia sp.]MBF0679485.1 hypothetical protein [Devosia sp.]